MDSDPSLACMRQLYRLYNCSGSAIRDITVVPKHKSTVFNFNSGNKKIQQIFIVTNIFGNSNIFCVTGLNSSEPDEVLAAYLGLVEQHCLHRVTVAPHADSPQLPPDIDNRRILYTWEKEYVVDWDEDPCVDQEDYDQELCPIEFSDQYYEDR